MSTLDLTDLFRDLGISNGNAFRIRQGGIRAQEPCVVQSVDELRSRLTGFGGSGWACFSETLVMPITPADAAGRLETRGYGFLLSAEFCDRESSLHIRQSRSGWIVNLLNEDGDSDGWLVEHHYLACIHPGNSLKGKNPALTYDVFWNSHKGAPFAARFSRFTGFVPDPTAHPSRKQP